MRSQSALPRLVLLAALVAPLAGCDSDSDDGGGDLAPGTVTAQIDGQPFTSSFALATPCALCEALGGEEGVEVAALDASGRGLGLLLVPFEGEGTYPLSDGSDAASGGVVDLPDGSSYATDLGGSGTVTVTRATDQAIEGTFSFTAGDGDGATVRVTEGRFNVPLQDVP